MDNALMQPTASPAEKATATTPGPRSKNRQPQHPDRIRINADAVKRLAVWSEQMGDRLRGVRLTRSDLVNFLILSHPETLSVAEMKDVQTQYFDEVKLVQWALVELVAAKARGEDITFHDIMTQYKPAESSAPRTRKRKSDDLKNSTNTDTKAQKQSPSTSKESPISVDNSAGR